MCNRNNFYTEKKSTIDRVPKVSILVPVYNVEKYLRECLNSLLCQTLNDIEVICIDDGSTDNSSNILAEYAVSDSRIIIITKENTGYGASMNLGLQYARGEYIGIVESDDYVLPEMFERLYMAICESGAEIVKANYYQVFSKKNKKNFIENLKGLPYERVINPLDEKECFAKAPTIWSGIYSRRFLVENRISFHETPGASFQDISFAFFTLYFARRVKFLKDAYLCYRCDSEGSSVKSAKKVFCVCDEMRRIERLIGNQNHELLQFVQAIKFSKYISDYYRIDSLYQYAFLLRVQNEYEEADKKGILKKDYWNPDMWQLMEKIKQMPDCFFEQSNRDYINRYIIAPHVMNYDIYRKALFDEIGHYSKVIIYGAGEYGKRALKILNANTAVYAFAVTKQDKNPEVINNIPVYEINVLIPIKEEVLIIIATKIQKQIQIINLLQKLGFKNIITLDVEMLKL